jgi:HKD family nuclease
MEVSFLGHGLGSGDKSAGDAILKSLRDTSFQKFTCFTAFASVPGVENIKPDLKSGRSSHLDEATIVVGIDQSATSKEALEALLKLEATTLVFYTKSSTTYHPKIYIFEGENRHRIIVGSSNLTAPGLFQNVESSIQLDFTESDKEGMDVLSSIKEFYNGFSSMEHDNIQKLSSELIGQLVDAGIVKKRSERDFSEGLSGDTGEGDNDPIEDQFPSISVQRPPVQTGKSVQETDEKTSEEEHVEDGDGTRGDLVWRKNTIPSSDAQEVGSGTHITGQQRLNQARWKIDGETIDQTTYFRYTVFGNQSWRRAEGKEIARVPFKVTILGDDLGVHHLEVVHDPDWEAAQRNVTTMIRWGDLIGEIKNRSITGYDFLLYEPGPSGGPYHIVIQ